MNVESSALNVERSAPKGAVFLSYARDDAAAARRIAEALRASGLEVWFDENELRGGDQWDAKIRKQIDACALFLPVISRHTQERGKGYFRLEWRLAVEQTRLMAEDMVFLAPVAIDDTPENGALVPPEFMRVQWMRLPGALPTPQFVEQINRLLGGKPVAGVADPGRRAAEPGSATPATKKSAPGAVVWISLGVVLAAVVIVFFVTGRREPTEEAARRSAPPTSSAAPLAPSSLTPSRPAQADAKSIAVLPFANMSADKDNEFLADGIHEDVLTSLAKIRDLKVISRTSVLAYRDTASRNLKKIATDLGVAVVLEGSVRRSGNKVRVTAQLIDARTDEHLWAENYDGDTSDVFALQAKLAQQIASALKATLTPGELSLIERRPTQDAQAYELYQRGKLKKQQFSAQTVRADYEASVALYEQALARDPNLALAHGDLVFTHGVMYWFGAIDPTPERRARAAAALAEVQRLAPGAPETRMAQGAFAYLCENDWPKALAELRAAEAGLPNDDQLKYLLAITHRRLGLMPEALGYLQRAVDLNPYEKRSGSSYIETLFAMRRFAVLPALAPRFLALLPGDGAVQKFFVDAQFELDGDRAAWLAKSAALAPLPADLHGLDKAYGDALRAGELVTADRILSDPRQEWYPSTGGAINVPASLLRAELARLRGDAAAAKKFAESALTVLAARRWAPRQEAVVRVARARARLCAGADGAVPELMQAMEQVVGQDKFIAVMWEEVARSLAATGHHEEALASLRHLFAGPSTATPGELRGDPFFAKLKSDPRFEEILRSAKPL